MLEIKCTGSPYEIGRTHGATAKEKIAGSLRFYGRLFEKSCALQWSPVVQEAAKYVEHLEIIAPRYLEEIRGIADGSGTGLLDILALNIRTEIMFGLFSGSCNDSADVGVDIKRGLQDLASVPSDGCTSLGWLTETGSFLCQNWDWDVDQGENLIICHIMQAQVDNDNSRGNSGGRGNKSKGGDIPAFSMVTEAGIIGKIGFNAAGVGCCLNAIKCRGVDVTKQPMHFALRKVLESPSRAAAIEAIKTGGVAGSGYILIGDATGSTGLECTSKWVREIHMDELNRVCHTNHLVVDKYDVDEPPWLEDSPARLARLHELTAKMAHDGNPTLEGIFSDIFGDTQGYPGSINRRQEQGKSEAETLFTILMDLTRRSAHVTFGRPTEVREQVAISF
ncbi:peptidase C45 acyl-coenzyme A:6-aminopenicillanic acid acyl-transferase-like protein [Xylariaceae sp. FL0594]|nr:peptidase C45 acyl-coenzyme A:6-aminopenicillanic acid acyl-transferase-like protein [Xylariaceae sp. FL0594]